MTLSPALAAVRAAHADQNPGPVRRAWPGADGSFTAEIKDGSGQLRAATISADGHLQLLPYGQDSKLPALEADLAAPETSLLVHRAGKRAVVKHPEQVTKHLKAAKVAGVVAASQAVGSFASEVGFTTAQVTDVTDHSLAFSLIPGTTPYDLADQSIEAWQRFATLWPRFLAAGAHYRAAGGALPSPACPFIPADHGVSQEKAVLDQWLAQAEAHGSLSGPGIDTGALEGLKETADDTMAQLVDGQPSPTALLHRDLHDKQLLWDGANLGILDLDTAAWGEPELDLGNLLAHLELRTVQGRISYDTYLRQLEHVQGMAVNTVKNLDRLSLYTQAARIRIACIYSFRPSSASWLGTWITRTLI
ncbi:phosphotransferase [Rothia nasimurium]|uniref:phosphotransferase n=1 Tax=Rothia nasimurium TaxID=85336 RepID=UPI003B9EB496